MNKYYELSIAGLKRNLPIIELSPTLKIASFNILGDLELIEETAKKIAENMPDGIDLIICPEAKSIPLVHSIAIKKNINYIVLRKSIKGYMKDPITIDVNSITTVGKQILVLDGPDKDKILNSKKIAIIDDVVSTGGSFLSIKTLLNKLNVKVFWEGTILLEGDKDFDGLFYLERLPIWQKNIKE
ncbi:MAG: adenine phosphoribosyltransferase [Bacteroidetes bacterium]|nr:MAG: adenine phosphoribosyltransferase [Bacteroidota bacterium]